MTDTDTPRPNRTVAIALAVTAAACLLAAAWTTSWLANPGVGDLSFGPRGCVSCCVDVATGGLASCTNGAFVDAFREMGTKVSGAFAPMGWATLGCCTLAALGLLAAAGLAALKKTPDLPIAPTTVALLGVMVSLITGCVFVATKPGPPGFVGVAWGFWAFGAGAVAGIASAQMLAKVLRPPDPDLLDGAMNPDDFST